MTKNDETKAMNSVFWSWQSDLDPRVTRDLIRDALLLAIDDLGGELEERIELTSDTKGVAGSPDIVATILAKIEAAAVFVGDATPIAVANGKALANPNVLIELGYAKHAIGLERVILIWNTAFEGATIGQLPFDMRGRRAPLGFHLAAGAPTAELRTVRETLRLELREALRASIAASTPVLAPPPTPAWQDMGATPGLWFDGTKRITINEDGEPGTKAVEPGPYAYVRILPSRWTEPTETAHDGKRPVILGRTNGYSWGASKGGLLVYTGSLKAREEQPLAKMVMQFRSTGELWGVNAGISGTAHGRRFFADEVIRSINDFIESNIRVLQNQRASGPFDVRIGVTHLEGYHWASETKWGGWPIALEEGAEAAFTVHGNEEDERLAALEIAWGEIAAAFGIPRPPRSTLVRQIRGY